MHNTKTVWVYVDLANHIVILSLHLTGMMTCKHIKYIIKNRNKNKLNCLKHKCCTREVSQFKRFLVSRFARWRWSRNVASCTHRGRNLSFFLYFLFPPPINHLINSYYNIHFFFSNNKTNHFLSPWALSIVFIIWLAMTRGRCQKSSRSSHQSPSSS
jgi:hypothetical protein